MPEKLLCESWNERMWADGGPIDPSPTIDGGYPWLAKAANKPRNGSSGQKEMLMPIAGKKPKEAAAKAVPP